MTDEVLKAMSKDDANKLFYESDKRRWCGCTMLRQISTLSRTGE